MKFRVIGRRRAGGSLAVALERAGWELLGLAGRDDDITGFALDADLVLVAVPDGEVAAVAHAIGPVRSTTVAHVAGSLGLDVLAPHEHRASLHPLVALPNAEVGADRLRGSWFAVAATDPIARSAVEAAASALGGRTIEVLDERRVLYHAAAVIASNHVVGVLGQAERVAAAAGVPLDVYLDLVRGTLDNVAALGPAAALTGPAARGDAATIARHLAALDPAERPGYEAGVALCRQLVRQSGAEEPAP